MKSFLKYYLSNHIPLIENNQISESFGDDESAKFFVNRVLRILKPNEVIEAEQKNVKILGVPRTIKTYIGIDGVNTSWKEFHFSNMDAAILYIRQLASSSNTKEMDEKNKTNNPNTQQSNLNVKQPNPNTQQVNPNKQTLSFKRDTDKIKWIN